MFGDIPTPVSKREGEKINLLGIKMKPNGK
jgi:hypothetical protein